MLLADEELQRPRVLWWMELRPVARMMARYTREESEP
jgi:hypothetical protein